LGQVSFVGKGFLLQFFSSGRIIACISGVPLVALRFGMVVDDGTIPAGLVVVDDDDCSVRSSKREQNNYMHGRTLYTVAVAVF
jgi:hypothetical protein